MTEDDMIGCHHWIDGHDFEQALGVGDGQGSLVCCSSWGCKESDMTEQLNWTKLLDYLVGSQKSQTNSPGRKTTRVRKKWYEIPKVKQKMSNI